eukprot:gene8288-10184_t
MTQSLGKESMELLAKSNYQPIFSVRTGKFKEVFDYSLNNAIVASRILSKPTKEIVQQLEATFKQLKHQLPHNEVIEKLEGNDKGYLNFKLSDQYLSDTLLLWSTSTNQNNETKSTSPYLMGLEDLKEHNYIPQKNVLVDFASPNMSKELHVGHIRSIVLGESVCRILEYMGHKVERVSHAGDFGTPMGMVIGHALETKQPFLRHIWDKTEEGRSGPKIIPTPRELSQIYSASKQRTKVDPEFEKKTSAIAAELQKGPPDGQGGGSDPDIYQAWLDICDASRIGFNEIFDLMQINAEERGESYYRTMLPGVIQELTDKGLVTLSEGAQCIFLPGSKDPVIIRKSDGGYLYATTDLAAIHHRVSVVGKDWIVYITDSSQSSHFENIFEIAKKAGWLDTNKTRVDHLGFGLVRDKSGSKLSSREGTSLSMIDLLKEAIVRSEQATRVSKTMNRSEILDHDHTAHKVEEPERIGDRFDSTGDLTTNYDHFRKVGMGALKYFDLSQRNSSYIFSYENMLSFKGNTSIYILYCYTRISALLQRASFNIDNINLNSIGDIKDYSEKERKLLFLITRFPDTIRSAENTLKPGIICDYLWDIADTFHQFYESERVIGSDRELQKLLICYATTRVLSTGLYLLGVETVERL